MEKEIDVDARGRSGGVEFGMMDLNSAFDMEDWTWLVSCCASKCFNLIAKAPRGFLEWGLVLGTVF